MKTLLTNGYSISVGVKRSSPLAPHQQPPRPSKLAHYDAPPTTGQSHHAHIYANGQVLQPPPAHDATTPSPTPSSSSSSCGRRSGSNSGKMLVEPPLLMSPEINSLMGDERPLQLSSHQSQTQMLQQHQQAHLQPLRVPHLGHGHGHSHSTTPTLGERRNANAADDGKLYVDQATYSARAPSPSPPTHAPQPQAHAPAHVVYLQEPLNLHQHSPNFQTRLVAQTVAEDLTMKRTVSVPELKSVVDGRVRSPSQSSSDSGSGSGSDSCSDSDQA